MALEAGSHFVALGSSFAAGPGLLPRSPGSPRLSGRSAVNNAHLVADRLDLDLDDATYSGATTGDILDSSSSNPARQIQAVTADTRLVTVTAGGNDIGYLPVLTLSSLPRPLRWLPSTRRRVAEAVDAATLDTRFAALEESLVLLVKTIRERAPRARTVLVDYLTILPPADAAWSGRPPPLTSGIVIWARDVATRLTETTEAVAAASGCEFVSAARASSQHHAWAAEPWTRRFHLGLRGGAPFHPTAAGMAGVADLLVRRLADIDSIEKGSL